MNQLEHILDGWTRNGGRWRRSALFATLLEPDVDHTFAARRGFPCLHYLCFAKEGAGGLALTAVYPMQYVFQRAYGNYLGLSRLGVFMAQEMGLSFTRMTCITSVMKRETSARQLRALVEPLIDAGFLT